MTRSTWWKHTVPEVAKILHTDPEAGLSSGEASARLDRYGSNELKEEKGRSPLAIFADQFRGLIIWVLIGAALVSGILQEWVDSLAIIAIVILNALLGFFQEYRAEKSLAALKKMSSPTARTVREGQRSIVPARTLVPGDLIELEAGDNIPADGRVIRATPNFAVGEASLTGESTPVSKTDTPQGENTALAERANMVYLGTSVISGKASILVCETGMDTELGRIAGMIQTIERISTPLQKKLEQFGQWIVYVCLALVSIIFILGIFRGGALIDMFMTAISLAVAAIPEGLPAVVTISLALGVRKMVKRHALIRKLPSVETLGCATVICTDKTGTLTKNEMTVQIIYSGQTTFSVTGVGYTCEGHFLRDGEMVDPSSNPDLSKSLECSVLCNGAAMTKNDSGYVIIGDPTEGALLAVACKAAISKDALEKIHPLLQEIPFDSERKKMTMIRGSMEGHVTAYTKGAPDVLLNDCSHHMNNGSAEPLTGEDRQRILQANNRFADLAMRVLAVAFRDLGEDSGSYDSSKAEKDLVFAGLLAMIDPPREEVRHAIRACKTAGIRTVMITGDHKNTAVAIARDLNISRDGSRALLGQELDDLSDRDFQDNVSRISVYARVSPEHKLRIVRAWKTLGEIVAMTGDGVNDAPAVKEADIGVAMGITGTDVTKEVSDMVITDDNFASIVSAVEEGRGIYDNIKKFVHYLLSCNAGEILVMFLSSMAGMPMPLLPIHILWVNLVTDGFPALALGMDPIAPDIMERPPRKTTERVVTGREAYAILVEGSFIALCSLTAFSCVLFLENGGIGRARTCAFIVLSCSQLFHAFNCRSRTESLFTLGFFTNKKLLVACAFSFFLQIIVVSVPALQKVFRVEALSVFDWFMVLVLSSFPLWAMELVKLIQKRAAWGNAAS